MSRRDLRVWRCQEVKVKVHKITGPYEKIATKSLQAILRNHAYDQLFVHIGAKQLYDIMGELVRRRQDSDSPRRTNEETWREFVRHCCLVEPSEEQLLQEFLTPHTLTPSFHGVECLGNGNWVGYECQCDECPYFLQCFPEFG